MPYISESIDNAIGDFVNGDVLCTFTVSAGGSLNMRIIVGTSANWTNIKLQHRLDDNGIWQDVKTFAQVGATNEASVLINSSDTTLIPIGPLCRIVATGDITTTSVSIAQDY